MKVKKNKIVFIIPRAQDAFNIAQFLLRWKANEDPLLRP